MPQKKPLALCIVSAKGPIAFGAAELQKALAKAGFEPVIYIGALPKLPMFTIAAAGTGGAK